MSILLYGLLLYQIQVPDVHLEVLFDHDGACGFRETVNRIGNGAHLLVDSVDGVGDLMLIDSYVIHCLTN